MVLKTEALKCDRGQISAWHCVTGDLCKAMPDCGVTSLTPGYCELIGQSLIWNSVSPDESEPCKVNRFVWNKCVLYVCDNLNNILVICTLLLHLFNDIVLIYFTTIRDAVDPKGLYFNTWVDSAPVLMLSS